MKSWLERASAVIAHSALTNSKRPESFVKNVYPTHLRRGCRGFVIDDKGNVLVDYICGLGTNLLGYGNRVVSQSIAAYAEEGYSLSLGSTLEVEYAESLQSVFPYLERMRFLKSGSEGCSAAVRIARAFTGRKEIASDAYHGWHDQFVSLTPPANGVPPLQCVFPLGRYFLDYPGEFAALIIEPFITDWSAERILWLKELREVTKQAGCLLIFDETITAFRFPGLSVAKFTGVIPDLTVMGKALAGGMPLSVVGGRADVMESDYFVSSTFAGEMLTLAAAQAVLDQVRDGKVVAKLWNDGAYFKNRFNAISPDIQIEGYPTRGVFKSKDELTQALFFQEACKQGILFGSSWFYCTEHPQYDTQVLDKCEKIISNLSGVTLEGEMPRKPYSMKVRDQ